MTDSRREEVADVFRSASPEETRMLGEAMGRAACAGDLIALIGDLGSGKTSWLEGLLGALASIRPLP